MHEAPASLWAGSAPVLSSPGRGSCGPNTLKPSEEGVGGCGPAAQTPTCQACRSSSRPCTRSLHMSVSFNSRGPEAAPQKLLPAPLPQKSRGAFLLASLPGPSGAHNSAPRTPFLHPASAACAPHPAPCTAPAPRVPPPRRAETRSPLAPEPLAAPARCLPGTEPNRASGGGGG